MFVIPDWLLPLLPFVATLITEVVKRLPALGNFGPRNLSALVAILLSVALAYTQGAKLPLYEGDVVAWIEATALLAVTVWKLSQIIYDAWKGKLASPDGHAT